MLRPGLVRLKALLLVFILLNGGGGMPLLDAALYHRHGVASTRVRAGADDAQRTHAQVCHLGWTIPHAANTGRVALGLAVLALPFSRPPAAPVDTPRSADVGGLPQPRAPPAPLA
jgi:hypothetical protein